MERWRIYSRERTEPMLVSPKQRKSAKMLELLAKEEQELAEFRRLMRTGADMTNTQRRRWFALSQRQDSLASQDEKGR